MEPGPTPYAVRKATLDDLMGIVRLNHSHESPELPPPDEPFGVQLKAWKWMMRAPDLTVLVALLYGEIVGNTSMTIVPSLVNESRPVAFVEPLLVAPDHRRQGVGTLMVQQLIADARAANCVKIQLLSHKRHATDGAHAFYQALGFEPEAEGFRLYLR